MAPNMLENCSKSKIGLVAVIIGLVVAVLLIVIIVTTEMENIKSEVTGLKGPTACKNGGTWNDSLKRCDGCRYFTFGPYCEKYITDCEEGREIFYKGEAFDSKMLIQPSGSDEPFFATCWYSASSTKTILVKRWYTHNENFNRSWNDLKHGFGNFDQSYFVGLENMHRLTKHKNYTCQVFIKTKTSSQRGSASYYNFRIESEADLYSLHYDSFYGTEGIGDGFGLGTTETQMKDSPFCTFDKDCNNCARTTGSGWWFNTGCSEMNLHLAHTESRNHLKWLFNNTLVSLSYVSILLIQ